MFYCNFLAGGSNRSLKISHYLMRHSL